MTKAELIDAIAKEADIAKAKAEKALEIVVKSITEELKAGNNFSLVGFGSFSVVERAARKGRNPQTGEQIDIPASKAVKFKAGSKLKDAVN